MSYGSVFSTSRFILPVLCLAIFAFAMASSAQAQSSSKRAEDAGNRLSRLENEVETLSRAVYKGETGKLAAAASAKESSALAANEIRLQQLENEIQSLRGQIEEQNHAISSMQTNLSKALDDIELRFGNLEGRSSPQAGAGELSADEPGLSAQGQIAQGNSPVSGGLTDGKATAQYEEAFAMLKDSKYAEASEQFTAFIEAYPDSDLVANAQYWLGESFYARGEYDKAARAFAEGYKKYPKGVKAPDNLLKLALSLDGLGKAEDACVALAQIKKEYAAQSASVLRRAEEEMKRLGCK